MLTKKVLTIGSMMLATAWCTSTALAQVQHGVLDVVENDGGNDNSSVTVTRVGGAGGWIADPNAANSRADYFVDFFTANDVAEGVLLVGPANDDRTEASVPSDPNLPRDIYHATVSTSRSVGANGTNKYWVAVHRTPQGVEVNYNAALAYFPIVDGWLMGSLYNSVNGGAITEFVGNPAIQLLTNFEELDPNFPKSPSRVIDSLASNYVVILDGIDQRRDGVLMGCGAKNEDNYTAVHTNADGIGVLNNRDNGDDDGGQEQDPSTFVYIPQGTPGVVMGTITGSGRTVFGQGDFDIEVVGAPTIDGTMKLTIPGADPNTGTLIVTPRTEFSGATVDNPIFSERDPNGYWLIFSRDIEPSTINLQDISAFDIAYHFAYFDNAASIVPVGPTKPYVSRLNDVVSLRLEVDELTADNGVGDVWYNKVAGADSLNVYADNRGDIGISWLQARPQARQSNGRDADDGLWFGNPTQFFRYSDAFGISAWCTVSSDNGSMPLHISDEIGGEFNTDFATAFFPIGAGFDQDADVGVSSGTFIPSLTDCIADALTEGVLMAINWDNNNRFFTVEPSGADYIARSYDGTTGLLATSSVEIGYTHIPFDTPNLVAGWVDANGAVLAGTGNFSTMTDIVSLNDPFQGPIDVPVTNITIPGVDPSTDGIIIVTSMGGSYNDANYTPAWQIGSGAFQVAGWDPSLLIPNRIAFGFVYVPFDGKNLAAPLAGDLDDDGVIDEVDGLLMIECINGEGVATPPAGCTDVDFRDADLECDMDVDMVNFAAVQASI
jgi:hypothetical protein